MGLVVRVLGCHGGVAPDYQTSCYEVNGRFLVDCGSACSAMAPEEQSKLTDIFITHPHLDHIKDICFILENTFSNEREPLVLRSSPGILDDIHKHMLNDVIWPDFSKIPVGGDPNKHILKFTPIKNETEKLDNLTITSFPVNHPGNAVGYVIDDGNMQVVFSGDTGPCAKLWQMANQCKNLRAVFTEITFPSRMDALATASGHYTLQQLIEDVENLENKDIPVYISHFKPLFLAELLDEFHRDAPAQLQLMHEADVYKF